MKKIFRMAVGVAAVSAIAALVLTKNGFAAEIKKPANYPNRAIEMVVPWGAGGGLDTLARMVAAEFEKEMGVAVGVINKPGANSVIGNNYALSQPADGYTLLWVTNDMLVNMARGTTDQKVEDFAWTLQAHADLEMFIARGDDDRFKSFDDYAKYAKANPGKVSIAVAGDGGIEMMAVALVNNALGIETKYIPFDKFSDRMAAFLGGHTDLMVEEPGDTLAMRKEGRMRALLIMADKRADALPGVPTAKEKGADVTLGLWRGIAFKAGTPPEIVKYVEAMTREALKTPNIDKNFTKKKFLDIRKGFPRGAEVFSNSVGKEVEQLKAALALMAK